MPGTHELHPQAAHGPTNLDPSQLGDAALLDRVTIINEQNGLYVAEVPIELIYEQDVPVSTDHVEFIASDLSRKAEQGKGTGQESPVSLAEVPGFHSLPIMDGFHRIKAFQQLGLPAIWATIRPGSKWEEVFAERVTLARRHAPLQFARIVEWAVEAWNQTPWAQQKGIAAMQAFNLGFSSHMTGAKMRGKNMPNGETLTTSEVADIRAWVDMRCEEWKLKAGSIYDYLATAERADPELVRQVRMAKGGRGGSSLTPYHLKAIAYGLPGPKNYDKQRKIAEIASYHGLTTSQVRALVIAVKEASTPQKLAQVLGPGLKGIVANRVYTRGEQRKRLLNIDSMRRDPSAPLVDAVALNQAAEKLFETELRAAALAIENTVLGRRGSDSTALEIFRALGGRARNEALPYIMALVRRYEAGFKTSPYLPPHEDEVPARPTADEVKIALPHMDTLERQAAILRIFYRLSTPAMAQILRMDEEPIRQALERMRTFGISWVSADAPTKPLGSG